MPELLHVLGVAAELLARGGQGHPGAVPAKQHEAEMILQGLDAGADRRLGDVQAFRGAVEVPAARDL